MPGKTFEITAQVSVPAGASANQTLIASFITDPRLPAVQQLIIPATETWSLDDIFVSSSQSIDLALEIKRNDFEILGFLGSINARLVSNPSRPPFKKLVYPANSKLTMVGINLAENSGTNPVVVTFTLRFTRYTA
jgi:hypothetical protein